MDYFFEPYHGIGVLGGLLQLDLLRCQHQLHGLDVLGTLDQLLQTQVDTALLLLQLRQLQRVRRLVHVDE